MDWDASRLACSSPPEDVGTGIYFLLTYAFLCPNSRICFSDECRFPHILPDGPGAHHPHPHPFSNRGGHRSRPPSHANGITAIEDKFATLNVHEVTFFHMILTSIPADTRSRMDRLHRVTRLTELVTVPVARSRRSLVGKRVVGILGLDPTSTAIHLERIRGRLRPSLNGYPVRMSSPCLGAVLEV